MIKNKKTEAAVLYVLMVLIGVIILDIPFGLEPVMFDDSPAFLQTKAGAVPMLGYPLFLSLNRRVFGEIHYLQIAVAWQIAFNLSGSILLIRCLRKKLALNMAESIMFYVLSFVPHTVFMPEGMSSRMIVTEALAFPLFYLLVICMVEAIWERKIKYGIIGLLIAILLLLVRTQLMLTLLIPVGVIFYLIVVRLETGKKYNLFLRGVIGICASLLFFIGALCIYTRLDNLLRHGMVILNRPVQIEYEEEQNTKQEDAAATELTEASNQDININSQGRGTFCSNMIFNAEYDDKELFADPDLSGFYEELYRGLQAKKMLLNSLDMDLFIADRIFVQIQGVYRESQYIAAQYGRGGEAVVRIAETLFRKHPLRWLKSGALQAPSGLISTVFFHRREIYWLSYLVTFLIYFGAFVSVIWAIKKKVPRAAIEFMVLAILINFLFVFATAAVFIALQRYVIYGFGIFYMALYSIMKPLVFSKKHG